jgi:hypothetical protein
MSRVGPAAFALILAVIWGAYALLLLMPGRLAVSGIEGDILHGLDGAMRMTLGAIPHVQFSTPLGAFAFGSLALPLGLGIGPGAAMLMANLGVALFLLPGLLWLRITRLGPRLSLLLALWAVAEASALVHDGTLVTTTFALYYNRWCWAVFALLFVLLMVPERADRASGAGDGLMLGLGLGFLAMTKMTYFVALVPPVLLWVLAGRRWSVLAWTLAGGLAVAAGVTLWAGGIGFWRAYLDDLLLVATSDMRAAPGLPFADVLASPAYLVGTLALLGSIVLLRTAGLKERGLLLFAAMPGMLYVTYQNWANAPVWLAPLLVVMLEAHGRVPAEARLAGRPLPALFAALALVILTQAVPLAVNMAASPFRHLGLGGEAYAPALAVPGWDDLLFLTDRGARMRADIPLGDPPPATDAKTRFEQEPAVFQGRSFPACRTNSGMIAQMQARAASLAALPQLAAGAFLTADLLNVTWMFTGGRPLVGGAPWYYGGSTGFGDADWIVVPMCPTSPLARGLALAELEASGWRFAERHADDVLAVYERLR